MGPNGAGKSTLLSILSGAVRPNEGRVLVNGQDVTAVGRERLARLGVVQTFQQAAPIPGLSVLENVLLGADRHFESGVIGVLFRSRKVREQEKACRLQAMELIESVGLSDHAQRLAENLSFGQLRFLEIARALASAPTFLLLDEPAAGINATEVDQLSALIKRLRASGTGILVVDHDVPFLLGICDDIVALDFGRVITAGKASQVVQDPRVREAYLAISTQSEEELG
jgi:branched-chain amino acid transport system ATP-binding protein